VVREVSFYFLYQPDVDRVVGQLSLSCSYRIYLLGIAKGFFHLIPNFSAGLLPGLLNKFEDVGV
jgi:hypothetical protein